MAVALLVAAGRGERLGSHGPKALVTVAGRPMLAWSLEVLRAAPQIDDIVVALPEGVDPPEGVISVVGGLERSHSVRAALAAAPVGNGLVLVHDAARPLVTIELIVACLAALTDGVDAAIAAAPVTDTVKETGADGHVLRTLDRSSLWSVQTPQVFRRAALERVLAQDDAVLAAATDDASLIEAAGGTVVIVPAPAENLKITTPIDLKLAALLLGR